MPCAPHSRLVARGGGRLRCQLLCDPLEDVRRVVADDVPVRDDDALELRELGPALELVAQRGPVFYLLILTDRGVAEVHCRRVTSPTGGMWSMPVTERTLSSICVSLP